MNELSLLNKLPKSLKTKPFVIGIDLGTTNSLMSIASEYLENAIIDVTQESDKEDFTFPYFIPVKLIQLPQQNLDGTVASHYLFPSVVFQESPESEILAGMGAREAKYKYRRGRQVFYSVKMDLGTDREPFYPSAVSEQLNTPVKISAIILKKMKEAAEEILSQSLNDTPVVITIPASFQSPQRRDTIEAAKLAGFRIDDQCLFDEPNAALLGYMNRRRAQLRWHSEETVLVFDFGGGTCDISIIDVSFSPVQKAIHLKNLALSRFEKLGGDDIDKHMVHKWLKFIFYEVSGRQEREWPYAERQHRIWSQLAKIAELLKIRFCEELESVLQGEWNEEKASKVVVSIPAQFVETSFGVIELPNLRLDWKTFNEIIQPFVDHQCSKNSNEEFYRVTSIFSPIKDALEKAGLRPSDITRILLAGGSSKNPIVEKEIMKYFPNANIERQKNMDYLVAEGAAVHAYLRLVYNHDILSPIAGDSIGIITEGGVFQNLIPAGSTIPFPNVNDWMTYEHFRVPRDGMDHVDLIICAGNINRPIHVIKLNFSRKISKDTTITLRLRLDGNKIFWIEAFLPDFPEINVRETIENPLGVLPMTSKERERAELENILAKAQSDQTLNTKTQEMEKLANVLLDLNLPEQALGWIEQITKRSNRSHKDALITKARAHLKLGEIETAHQIYAELSDRSPGDANLAINASLTAPDLRVKERFIRRAVDAAPSDGVCWYFFADFLLQKGAFEESRIAFEKSRDLINKALRAYPESIYYLEYLAIVLDSLEEEDEANVIRNKIAQLKSKKKGALDTSFVPGVAILPN